jgi:2-polyprenyl-6-methoxyphenol hydroxylase-like FAD-dependent oxidoreductase
VLWPAALHALGRLGVPVDELADSAVPLARKVFHLGGEAFGHPLDEPASPWPVPLSIGQDHLERVLHDTLDRLGADSVEYGVRVCGATEDDDGVLVDLAGPGGHHRVRARFLVLALGDTAQGCALAGVRRTVDGTGRLRQQADAELLDAALPGDEEHIFLAGDASVTFVPLPGNRHRVCVTLPPGEHRPPEVAVQTLTGVRLAWREAGWSVEPRRALAAAFRNGRRLLVGECAKTTTQPTHGLNGGIQDAANLAWKLAAVVTGAAADSLLETYAVERHAVARALLDSTARTFRYGNAADVAGTLRPRVGRRAYDLRTQPEVCYEGSPLTCSLAEHPGTPAGARLPQRTIIADGRPGMLYDVIPAARWTVLARTDTLTRAGAARLDRLARARPWLAVRHVTPPLTGPVPPELCLVRPDGYISLVGSGKHVHRLDAFLTSAGYQPSAGYPHAEPLSPPRSVVG